MTDIIEKLARSLKPFWHHTQNDVIGDAMAEITNLRAANAALKRMVSDKDGLLTALRAELDAAARDMRDKWPSREVVAREIRRAMLDNPTDDSFNVRSQKREEIANDVADIIIARFHNGPPHGVVVIATEQNTLQEEK